jgi:signal transduction histidine kinase
MPTSKIAFEQPELFEQWLSELSATFVSLPVDQIAGEIDRVLSLLLEALDLDRSSVAETTPDGRMEVTHSQTTAGAPPLVLGDLASLLPWYAEMLSKGELLRFERLPDELPPEATAERGYCERTGLRSQLAIPFLVADRLLGAIGFASFKRQVHWSDRLVRSLRLVSEVLANALARKQAELERSALREQLAHTARVNAMGEVVASIAHEVNQPLFAIVSNARAAGQLLARKNPDVAEIGAALDDIVHDANRASSVIARVRAFLQRKPTEQVPVDVNAIIETVKTFLGPELARRRIKIVLGLSGELPSVVGDAVQLQQVLVNLLMNGAEAMEGLESRQRTLEVRTLVDPGQRIRIDVIDHGRGFEPGSASRLFDPFFTTKPSGLGMGLAICKSIVEAHGGRIQPLLRSGPGTTMQIWLPIRQG